MTVFDFPLLADENIQDAVIAELRRRGLDISTVHQAGLAGQDDLTVIRHAVSEQRVILTHDRDFGTLALTQHEPIVGIVYLRPGHIDSQFTIATLDAIASKGLELSAPFMLIAKRSSQGLTIRLRQL